MPKVRIHMIQIILLFCIIFEIELCANYIFLITAGFGLPIEMPCGLCCIQCHFSNICPSCQFNNYMNIGDKCVECHKYCGSCSGTVDTCVTCSHENRINPPSCNCKPKSLENP
jgi:hypothetical protein